MKRPVENIPASIQARLKNEADKRGRFFDEILQYYGMERFFYRLSKTAYAITFVGYLGNVRLPVQVDVAFPDELVSGTLDIEYPVLLSGMERPQLKGYPLESMISEKFHAMIRFAELNSRWKDYYDLYLLAGTFEFGSQLLIDAIKATFSNRPTKLMDGIPYGLRDEFAVANQENWESFLHKSKLENDSITDLKEVINRIWQFMEYPLQGVKAEVQVREKRWTPNSGWR